MLRGVLIFFFGIFISLISLMQRGFRFKECFFLVRSHGIEHRIESGPVLLSSFPLPLVGFVEGPLVSAGLLRAVLAFRFPPFEQGVFVRVLRLPEGLLERVDLCRIDGSLPCVPRSTAVLVSEIGSAFFRRELVPRGLFLIPSFLPLPPLLFALEIFLPFIGLGIVIINFGVLVRSPLCPPSVRYVDSCRVVMKSFPGRNVAPPGVISVLTASGVPSARYQIVSILLPRSDV